MVAPVLPAGFDPIYFSHRSWPDRVTAWVLANGHQFGLGNKAVVENAITDEDAGLRVVVNIGSFGLKKLLETGDYLNLYERPVIGDEKPEVPQNRIDVDSAFRLDEEVYFGAVALGGAGVRYYGEFCLVLELTSIAAGTQIVDRDSYDILMAPINGVRDAILQQLVGTWGFDLEAMVMLKVLPEVTNDLRLMTAGTVSDLILIDQEFIEVHLRPNRDDRPVGGFGPEDIAEMRESPDEVAVATRLREREIDGLRLTLVESELLRRREGVMRALSEKKIPARVVTEHGRGYQWK